MPLLRNDKKKPLLKIGEATNASAVGLIFQYRSAGIGTTP
jgi:hypothetical protein